MSDSSRESFSAILLTRKNKNIMVKTNGEWYSGTLTDVVPDIIRIVRPNQGRQETLLIAISSITIVTWQD